MDKFKIKDIQEYTFKRSTLINIPKLERFFSMNKTYTPQQIFCSIVREALGKFEFYYPLFLINKTYINAYPNRMFEFQDNFSAFIAGEVTEDRISLVPSSVIGFTASVDASVGSMIRTFRYDPPRVTEFWYSPRDYWVHMLCRRPLVEAYDEVSKGYTDTCAVYYISNSIDSASRIFLDQVYVETCRYILNMKKNLTLSNMPIELFQGLEEDLNKIEGTLENHYSNSLNSGVWLR